MFVSYDPNIRPFFLDDREAAWADVVGDRRACARLVKLSDEDLRLLRPDVSEEDVCRELLAGDGHRAGGPHPRGRRARWRSPTARRCAVPAPPTDVVDTVGAGDSFMAAMLAMLCDWGVVADGEGAAARARRRPGAAAGAGRRDGRRGDLLPARG